MGVLGAVPGQPHRQRGPCHRRSVIGQLPRGRRRGPAVVAASRLHRQPGPSVRAANAGQRQHAVQCDDRARHPDRKLRELHRHAAGARRQPGPGDHDPAPRGRAADQHADGRAGRLREHALPAGRPGHVPALRRSSSSAGRGAASRCFRPARWPRPVTRPWRSATSPSRACRSACATSRWRTSPVPCDGCAPSQSPAAGLSSCGVVPAAARARC